MDPEYSYDYNPLVGDFHTCGRASLDQGFGPWQGYDQAGNYWADFYCLAPADGMYGHGQDWDVYLTDAVPSDVRARGITEHGLGWAAHLYRNYALALYNQNTVSDQLHRAALQVALWEVAYDGAPGYAWDLDDGKFQLLGIDNISSFGYTDEGFGESSVQPFLEDFGQDVATYWDDGQDVIGPPMPEPVPEPTSLMLLGLGLAGTGWVLRKRRQGAGARQRH